MADDLLTNIRAEIEERLRELRPLLDERLELNAALAALSNDGRGPTPSRTRDAGSRGPRARDAGPRAARVQAPSRRVGAARQTASPVRTGPARSRAARSESAGTGVARDEIASGGLVARAPARKRSRPRGTHSSTDRAILAALEHGSHTVAELLVVTGLPAREIRDSLRLMRMQRAIVTTDRENKTAYALPGD
ncbi:MAG TPA: hypothetical protein VMG80_03270 [Solirubrobacteraceae bacterium]|nr:hypothetical protein [Solirubrobacteraceae bacterium]